jgi:hypothetical protein
MASTDRFVCVLLGATAGIQSRGCAAVSAGPGGSSAGTSHDKLASGRCRPLFPQGNEQEGENYRLEPGRGSARLSAISPVLNFEIYFSLYLNSLQTYPVSIPNPTCYGAAMATPAQIAANRLNAMKSTGPRTVEGKAASRMNALQHGIDARASVLPGEDPDAFEALADEYREHYQPSTAEQAFLVDTMIQADWNRRRYARIQAELTTRLLNDMDPADRSLAALFMPDNPAGRALNRVIRHYEAAQNAWFRALKELQRMQKRDSEALPDENWLRSDDVPSVPSETQWSAPIPEAPPPANLEILGVSAHRP